VLAGVFDRNYFHNEAKTHNHLLAKGEIFRQQFWEVEFGGCRWFLGEFSGVIILIDVV